MKILTWIMMLFLQQAAVQPPTGTIVGQIRSQNGTAVSGIRVAAMAEPQPGVSTANASTLERITTPNSEGRYRLESISPGRYYITAGFVDSPTYYPGASTLANARTVAVAGNSTVQGIDFTLAQSAGVRVSGRL